MQSLQDRAGDTGRQPTAMILDPDVLVRITVADYLRDCGYRVIEGVRAEDLWTVLAAGTSVDVVLTEVALAGEADGFAVSRRLRAEYPAVDVILAASAARVADRAAQLCDQGPLDKPYHPQALMRRLDALRRRRKDAPTAAIAGRSARLSAAS
jgi:DNA-binding response OmpR family regulator